MEENNKTLSHESILALLRTWHHTHDTKKRWANRTEGNKAKLAHMEAVLLQVEASLPTLQAWCAEYMMSMTAKDQLRGWLLYGLKNRERTDKVGWDDYPLTHHPADFETHWKLFFRKDSNDADVIVLGDKEFDISYRHYVALLKELHRKWWTWSSNYDEPSVVAIHEGKPCDQDFCCFVCDEQTDAWRTHLMTVYRSKHNIFLNPACGKEFATRWLDSVASMSRAEQADIHWVWPPPFTYFDNYVGFESKEVTTHLEAYLAYLVDSRQHCYYTYSTRPLVEFERVRVLLRALNDYHVPDFDVADSDWHHDMFLFVSKFLLYAPYLLYVDKKFCAGLLAVYEGLPDD